MQLATTTRSSTHTLRKNWKTPAAGQVRSLIQCHFDVVDGCQLSCVGCPSSTLYPTVRRISITDFKACLHNIDVKAIGLFRLFNYGEPFLHNELPSLVEQIPLQRWKAQQIE